MRPDKENIAKWVRALRSGDYQQGRGALISYTNYQTLAQETRHCCLGVATEEAIKAGVELRREGQGYTWDDGTGNGATQAGLLPTPVAQWLGITEINPLLGGHAATSLNDISHLSFDDIADEIVDQYDIEEVNDEHPTQAAEGSGLAHRGV